MKRILIIFITLFTFISCNKEETLQEKIIGKWEPDGTYYAIYINDEEWEHGESNDGDFVAEFHSDGSGFIQELRDEDEPDKIRWNIHNNQLFINYSEFFELYDIIYIEGDKMRLMHKYEFTEGIYSVKDITTYHFKRSK